MAKKMIGVTLIEDLTGRRPKTEQRYHDTKQSGFFLRHLPNGRLLFGVVLGSKTLSLGPVEEWPDAPETTAKGTETIPGFERARRHAADLRGRHARGEEIGSRRRASTTSRTLIEVFGHLDGREEAPLVTINQGRSDVGPYLVRIVVKALGGSTPIDSITGAQVKAALDARYAKRPVAIKTKIRYALDLKAAWKAAIDGGHATRNPLDQVSYIAEKKALGKRIDKSKIVRWLTPDEEAALRDALMKRDRRRFAHPPRRQGLPRRHTGEYFDAVTPIILLALNTGARHGALLSLRWRDVVSIPAPSLTLRGETQKAGQTYHVPLSREARAVLKAWRESLAVAPRLDDLIFPSRTGGRISSIHYQWDQVRDSAGLRGGSFNFRFHDLRHSFASKLVQRKEDGTSTPLFDVSKLLGHADMRMTARYAHLSQDHLRMAIDSLDKPLAAAVKEDQAGAA